MQRMVGGGSRNQYVKRHINGEVPGGFVTGNSMFEFVSLVKEMHEQEFAI